MELRQTLLADGPIGKQATTEVEALLAGETPQADSASEAGFYARAAQQQDRVVINADIKTSA